MRLLRFILTALFGVITATLLLTLVAYAYIAPELPSTEKLRNVELQVPLRIYDNEQRLVAEFGEKRRIPVVLSQVPQRMIQAFLAAEDDRFFEHPGVDYQGLLRAGFELVRTGEKRQGGSTITMQVARNFFLTSEKTYLRKVTEILLALKIERELSKSEILELYLNKIYLGQRAYGVAAAAQVYYGANLNSLSLAQMAMIAGLPKAPSTTNPVTNPQRALARRNYILERMYELGQIDEATRAAAQQEPDQARLHAAAVEVEAPYLAEMVRAELFKRFGEDAYAKGLRVYTTLDGKHQAAANAALRAGVLEYDRRHGYRGPERRVTWSADASPAEIAKLLRQERSQGGLMPAIVIAVDSKSCRVVLRDGSERTLEWEALSWRRYISADQRAAAPTRAADVVAVGDVIRLAPVSDEDGAGWRLAQLPAAEAALVALQPDDGAVLALVGGFDFARSKFNRAAQANRQPGSAFKPFVYSAALDKGFTPASVLNDAPIVFDDPSLTKAWRPENYTGRFYGPTRLREALVHSRNVVSIRLLQEIGVRYTIDYVRRFGLRKETLYPNLALALGTGTVTPLEMTRAYAVFANGGYLIDPYFIERIVDAENQVLFQAQPRRVCPDCGQGTETFAVDVTAPEPPAVPTASVEETRAPAVLSPQNAWLMTSMLQDVIQRGTGQRARALGRTDLAGKTGTTNEQRDAWFCGYNNKLVASAWIGFDVVAPLGDQETGGHAALPIWMRYVGKVLDGVPEQRLEQPAGLITVRIDPRTGLLAGAAQPDAIFETFREDQVPTSLSLGNVAPGQPAGGAPLPEQLF